MKCELCNEEMVNSALGFECGKDELLVYHRAEIIEYRKKRYTLEEWARVLKLKAFW